MNKTKATAPGQPSMHVALSSDEVAAKLAEDAAYALKRDYSILRKERYEAEIDPLMSEALADLHMESNSVKMDALSTIRAQIKLDIPKP